ncbi:MAG TPA: SRPBCC family protein [Bryobacteraceae bacterium]|nr:SRPBCC family protein [Bryobacteraceae bacterium]
MSKTRVAVNCFTAGAAFMYFFDPARGRRRRAGVRDTLVCAGHGITRELDKARRDLVNRTHGMTAAAKTAFRDRRADDDLLVLRVRSKVGRAVSHPHAINVKADHCCVTLEGVILRNELEPLLRAVKSVPGVKAVVNKLETHEESENLPELQGGMKREARQELMQQNWTPSLRVAAAGFGGALVSYSLRGEGVLRSAGGMAGAALLARAVANKSFRQIFGVGAGPRTIEFEKALHVFAPVDEVFAFWANYQNFPRFMSHLKEVRDLGECRSHWVAEGPGGFPISWDAEMTYFVPNKLLGWRSLRGSLVETEGVVRFDSNPDGSTRVGIRLFYTPPGGALGHMIASLFGADPKHEMNDDLARFKSLIEMGKTHAHGAPVSVDEVKPLATPWHGAFSAH